MKSSGPVRDSSLLTAKWRSTNQLEAEADYVILANYPLGNQILKWTAMIILDREANATASAENSSSPFELLFRLACDGLPRL